MTPRLRTEEPHALARAALDDVLLPGLDVVDVWRERHPEARQYTWFRRGGARLDAARVDYALVSKKILPRVSAAEIHDAPEARFSSDHAPITIDVTLG